MKLLIVSDIHGNLPALEAVLDAEPDFDAAAFAGDVVDYGPNPVECIQWLREAVPYKVRGNHDNALAFNADCQCVATSREYSLATREWHRTLLSENDLSFLRALPVLDWFEWGGQHFRMAHGTPHGNLFEYLPMDQWEERVRDLDADFVILGHTHVQGMRTFDKTTVVNPGSVGLARDGAGQASYAILEDGRVTLKRVPYDVERTVAALQKAPLPALVILGLSRLLRGSAARGAESVSG